MRTCYLQLLNPWVAPLCLLIEGDSETWGTKKLLLQIKTWDGFTLARSINFSSSIPHISLNEPLVQYWECRMSLNRGRWLKTSNYSLYSASVLQQEGDVKYLSIIVTLSGIIVMSIIGILYNVWCDVYRFFWIYIIYRELKTYISEKLNILNSWLQTVCCKLD